MPTNNIRKAIIPAAGFGTRLFPATKIVKKELFPIIDRDGRVKPIIQLIVEEALSAGIEEIGIVVQECDIEIFANFFKTLPKSELFNKLSPENQEYSQYLQDLGERVTFLTQTEQEGYGHAVYCAKEWVNDQPFMLLLGDHVYASETETSCAGQILAVYQQFQQSAIGLTIMSSEIIHKAGCVTGVWQDSDSILSVTEIYEKPDLEYARQHLRVERLAAEQFLGIFGIYILTPKIFDILAETINQNIRQKGEFQLTSCLEILRQEEGMTGYLVKGQYFDTGMPQFYRQTIIDFPSLSR
ncbi:UTP--glucose-1-phosphate uridylyltransferase [Limnofasciculus baicalensis]|uniref:UTP--glucose-1-phosphate uridylyltransferase n=1 Tax=Limnofasciculus baicalensis BBK-W-15 TaxID=2699891 RepID=A0AAE3GRA0_9CYAN|nr:UTP--glucose-1-phosphate uridylyltransferase [Limnofasciculus baicalensis]MCP2728403.1 UTP--glucose-1-phosphate uridylyltransferase [Limnofasciculus baicalensis BBK-W-15]